MIESLVVMRQLGLIEVWKCGKWSGRVVRNVLVITRVLYELNDDKLNAQECGRHLPHLIRALIPPNR